MIRANILLVDVKLRLFKDVIHNYNFLTYLLSKFPEFLSYLCKVQKISLSWKQKLHDNRIEAFPSNIFHGKYAIFKQALLGKQHEKGCFMGDFSHAH